MRSIERTIDSAFGKADRDGPADMPEPDAKGDTVLRVIEGGSEKPDTATSFEDDEPESLARYSDFAALLEGRLPEPPKPTILTRQDGHSIFYKREINYIYGDPGIGKTWAALAAVSEALCNGGKALFIDLGTNENTNRLLRQYLHKNADLASFTQDHLNGVAAKLNHRPRRVLDWTTPAEAFSTTQPHQMPLRPA
jgi:hypothetical protein